MTDCFSILQIRYRSCDVRIHEVQTLIVYNDPVILRAVESAVAYTEDLLSQLGLLRLSRLILA